jgi:hypothetical protein
MESALIAFSILAFVAFLIWNRTRGDLERRKLEADVHARMLDKLGPGQVLTDFLKTSEGKQFFAQLTASPLAPTRSNDAAHKRILVLTTLGLIALFAGFVFIMGVLIPTQLSQGPGASGRESLFALLPVLLLTGAGAGALVAAWIMHRLSKKWGMLEADELRETPS